MAALLSLETSTDVCSVALHENGTLLALSEVHISQAHGSKLAPAIREVMALADLRMNDLQAVAVSAGPGSYTGLRIGTSTAKGLCFALGIPLISVGTLDVMASQMADLTVDRVVLCPMIDARRMEVYCALYDHTAQRLTAVEARIIDGQSFADTLVSQRIVFAGNGAGKCREVIRHDRATFVSGVFPSARNLGSIAWRKLQAGDVEDLVRFEPFYLKEYKAKLPSNIIAPALNKPA